LPDVAFCFELHQPLRLRRWPKEYDLTDFPAEHLLESYFDYEFTRALLQRAAGKSYYPATRLLLDLVRISKKDGKPFKLGFSLSGSFIEQCEIFEPGLLDVFRELVDTGYVELLSETYYHSLAYFFRDSEEFEEQVRMHQNLIKRLFGYQPTTFQNTEMIYSNGVAKRAEELGFKGIYTEGTEKILGSGRSPNFAYRPHGCSQIKLLLRNYQLTDDIAFRFSLRTWPGWPLTADKYAGWLSDTPGHCISIFMDFETLGEHHWEATGIFDFLKHLPHELSRYPHLNSVTPSEATQRHDAVGEINVPDSNPVSWADLERDTSAWLLNKMQLESFERLRKLEPQLRRLGDPYLMKAWRYLQTSDHIYYMSTKGGGTGEVHSYFSPYSSPRDAYETFTKAISDLEQRVGIAYHQQ
jgi:alpha-amylase